MLFSSVDCKELDENLFPLFSQRTRDENRGSLCMQRFFWLRSWKLDVMPSFIQPHDAAACTDNGPL